MNVGNRSTRSVLRAPFQAGHYRALAGMFRTYVDPLESGRRYLRSGPEEYPYAPRLRTPAGVIAPTVYSSHDMSTVNEIFCRQDYAACDELGVVVDVGSNIGISALYFLTRNSTSYVHCFEPNPMNVERLHRTLANFAGRYEVQEVAVGTSAGEASFGIEETGRYGSLEADDVPNLSEVITVEVRSIASVVGEVLDEHETIDILKVDIEDQEEEVVGAIPTDQLRRIKTIYFESADPAPMHEGSHSHAFTCQTNRLTLLGGAGPR